MSDIQEWQQENSNRAFPFSESVLNEAGAIPLNFIVDLKFSPDRWQDFDVFVASLSYFQDSDQYGIVLKYTKDMGTAINVLIDRTSEGLSRVGKSISIKGSFPNEYSTLLLTPGPLWDPVLLHEGDGTPGIWVKANGEYSSITDSYIVSFTPGQSAIDDSVVNPGPETIRRLFIQPVDTNTTSVAPIPPASEWGREVKQRLVGGYNISITQDATDPRMIIIDSSPGSGDGYPPADTSTGILKINGAPSTGRSGKFHLSTEDCLMHVEAPVPNTVQLISNCLPCCSCEEYRAVSAAITRRSSKIKQMCDLLSNMIVANTALYNEAVDKINTHRLPIVQVRNFRVYPNYFKISVQNVCTIPVYAHFTLSFVYGPSDLSLVETGAVVSDPSVLAPLSPTTKDYFNATPAIPVGTHSYITSVPLSPGGYQDFTFAYSLGQMESNLASIGGLVLIGGDMAIPSIEAQQLDLRNSGLQISCQANGIYGAQKTYGCKVDTYSAKVEPGPDAISVSCDSSGFTTSPTWQIKQITP